MGNVGCGSVRAPAYRAHSAGTAVKRNLRMNDEARHARTFSQRFGYEPVPSPLKLGHLSRDLRRDIWNTLRQVLLVRREFIVAGYHFKPEAKRFIERVLGEFLRLPEDEISTDCDTVVRRFKDLVRQEPFNRVLDLIELVANDEPGIKFATDIANVFDEHCAAYWLDVARRPYQFIPRSSEAQGKTTKQALKTIRESGMRGAEAHLRQAASHISEGRFAESVKDSILAVESTARVIDSRAEKTLGPALNSLETAGVIRHRALKEAFSKLYGYTSDEEGIRHALLERAAPTVDLDEAVFMFGACASFAAYLASKERKL